MHWGVWMEPGVDAATQLKNTALHGEPEIATAYLANGCKIMSDLCAALGDLYAKAFVYKTDHNFPSLPISSETCTVSKIFEKANVFAFSARLFAADNAESIRAKSEQNQSKFKAKSKQNQSKIREFAGKTL